MVLLPRLWTRVWKRFGSGQEADEAWIEGKLNRGNLAWRSDPLQVAWIQFSSNSTFSILHPVCPYITTVDTLRCPWRSNHPPHGISFSSVMEMDGWDWRKRKIDDRDAKLKGELGVRALFSVMFQKLVRKKNLYYFSTAKNINLYLWFIHWFFLQC